MKQKAYDILNEALIALENAEINQAPSGEWEEYNIDYIRIEARAEGIQELADAIGCCHDCINWIKDCHICAVFNKKRLPDDYCSEFERN